MTIKEIGETIKSISDDGMDGLKEALKNASVSSIIKAVIFVGASVYTGYLAIRAMWNRHKVKKNPEKYESPVEKALGINPMDRETYDKFHAEMSSVEKACMSKKSRKKVLRHIKDLRSTLEPEEKDDFEQLADMIDPDWNDPSAFSCGRVPQTRYETRKFMKKFLKEYADKEYHITHDREPGWEDPIYRLLHDPRCMPGRW